MFNKQKLEKELSELKSSNCSYAEAEPILTKIVTEILTAYNSIKKNQNNDARKFKKENENLVHGILEAAKIFDSHTERSESRSELYNDLRNKLIPLLPEFSIIQFKEIFEYIVERELYPDKVFSDIINEQYVFIREKKKEILRFFSDIFKKNNENWKEKSKIFFDKLHKEFKDDLFKKAALMRLSKDFKKFLSKYSKYKGFVTKIGIISTLIFVSSAAVCIGGYIGFNELYMCSVKDDSVYFNVIDSNNNIYERNYLDELDLSKLKVTYKNNKDQEFVESVTKDMIISYDFEKIGYSEMVLSYKGQKGTIQVLTHKFSLDTPYLSLEDRKLVWTEPQNVTHFNIYYNHEDNGNVLLETTASNSIDVSNYYKVGVSKFYVEAINEKSTHFERSLLSNFVEIKCLNIPVILSYKNSTITWNDIDGATNYSIYLDDELESNSVNGNSFKFERKLSVGEHKVKILPNSTNNKIFSKPSKDFSFFILEDIGIASYDSSSERLMWEIDQNYAVNGYELVINDDKTVNVDKNKNYYDFKDYKSGLYNIKIKSIRDNTDFINTTSFNVLVGYSISFNDTILTVNLPDGIHYNIYSNEKKLFSNLNQMSIKIDSDTTLDDGLNKIYTEVVGINCLNSISNEIILNKLSAPTLRWENESFVVKNKLEKTIYFLDDQNYDVLPSLDVIKDLITSKSTLSARNVRTKNYEVDSNLSNKITLNKLIKPEIKMQNSKLICTNLGNNKIQYYIDEKELNIENFPNNVTPGSHKIYAKFIGNTLSNSSDSITLDSEKSEILEILKYDKPQIDLNRDEKNVVKKIDITKNYISNITTFYVNNERSIINNIYEDLLPKTFYSIYAINKGDGTTTLDSEQSNVIEFMFSGAEFLVTKTIDENKYDLKISNFKGLNILNYSLEIEFINNNQSDAIIYNKDSGYDIYDENSFSFIRNGLSIRREKFIATSINFMLNLKYNLNGTNYSNEEILYFTYLIN